MFVCFLTYTDLHWIQDFKCRWPFDLEKLTFRHPPSPSPPLWLCTQPLGTFSHWLVAGMCLPYFSICEVMLLSYLLSLPLSWELQTRILQSHLLRTQSLKVIPLKPRVGQYIAICAVLAARDFLLAIIYPSSPFTCIFFRTSPNFSCVGCG